MTSWCKTTQTHIHFIIMFIACHWQTSEKWHFEEKQQHLIDTPSLALNLERRSYHDRRDKTSLFYWQHMTYAHCISSCCPTSGISIRVRCTYMYVELSDSKCRFPDISAILMVDGCSWCLYLKSFYFSLVLTTAEFRMDPDFKTHWIRIHGFYNRIMDPKSENIYKIRIWIWIQFPLRTWSGRPKVMDPNSQGLYHPDMFGGL